MVPLGEVMSTLETEVAERRREEILRELVAEARERYNVRVFERNLPFNYAGRYGSGSTDENP